MLSVLCKSCLCSCVHSMNTIYKSNESLIFAYYNWLYGCVLFSFLFMHFYVEFNIFYFIYIFIYLLNCDLTCCQLLFLSYLSLSFDWINVCKIVYAPWCGFSMYLFRANDKKLFIRNQFSILVVFFSFLLLFWFGLNTAQLSTQNFIVMYTHI